ncbi:hypothetical protein O6V14_09460 [Sphingomonas faeni]|uniref:hypothetical protein n=1 Tax=Sphingomonas faeni TaxID=185950 RepID=UPI0033502F25
MLKTLCAVATIVFLSTKAEAQQGQELWHGLRVGMTKEEVRTILPKNEIDLLPDCRASISIRYESNRLVSVMLGEKWLLSKNNCISPMTTSLAERYGKASRSVIESPSTSPLTRGSYEQYVWTKAGILIDYRSQLGGRSWSLTYRLAPESTPSSKIEGL